MRKISNAYPILVRKLLQASMQKETGTVRYESKIGNGSNWLRIVENDISRLQNETKKSSGKSQKRREVLVKNLGI
jgi:ABC-type phosphonate transport system ATPase subunit